MEEQSKIQVFADSTALAAAAAKQVADLAEKAVAARGRFVISLSGGHTPEQLYSLLAKPPYHDTFPWAQTFVFWGDERCVPGDDPQNNARMAKQVLLDQVPVPQQQVFPVQTDLPPAEAALAYERDILKLFDNEAPFFDLMLLGLGENGHTASLFPGTEVLFENTHLVREVYVEELGMYRITMTAGLINQSRDILFLVAGKSKAAVLKDILESSYQPDKYPAQLIQPLHGNLYWLADEAAAALLPHKI